jgi:hypothetical protein
MFPFCGGISIQVSVYVSSDPIKKRVEAVGWNRHVAIGLLCEWSVLCVTAAQLSVCTAEGATTVKPNSQ